MQPKNSYCPISEDSFIYDEGLLMQYLYECLNKDRNPVIDFCLEGPCFEYNGLYRLLDNFCAVTGFAPKRVTLITANMIENHVSYVIKKNPSYWYEVSQIQSWLRSNAINTGHCPHYHFANFIGRSTWSRLWVATILNLKYDSLTMQTFNSSIRSHYVVKDDTIDCLGLEDLVRNNCDIILDVLNFLESCPRIIPNDLREIKKVSTFISQAEHYPIQHPANLNILKYYHNIFVDIVCETRVMGNTFFVTEKTWRCIVARRPFIIVGSQHFLTNLKKLGFKTFSNWWDEGYDDYSPSDRIIEIQKVLEHIAHWTVDDLSIKLKEMKSVLDHNYNVFRKLTYQQIAESFND